MANIQYNLRGNSSIPRKTSSHQNVICIFIRFHFQAETWALFLASYYINIQISIKKNVNKDIKWKNVHSPVHSLILGEEYACLITSKFWR